MREVLGQNVRIERDPHGKSSYNPLCDQRRSPVGVWVAKRASKAFRVSVRISFTGAKVATARPRGVMTKTSPRVAALIAAVIRGRWA